MSVWREVELGDICEFKYGKSLSASNRDGGPHLVYGSNGVVGRHSATITTGPTIVIGRKGSFGEVAYSESGCWPIDTTYYIDANATQVDLRWLSHVLPSLGLTRLNRAAAIPGLNREDAYRQRLLLPPLHEQHRIAAVLDRAGEVRAARRHVLKRLDELPAALFRHVSGDPAANPRRWEPGRLGDLSTQFSDGPFGSNLKSAHYTRDGVRVIRLQNIGVGRFLPDDAAFVAPEHFATLRRHECQPGDVLVGTLGDPNLRACLQPPDVPVALNKADCVQIRVNPERADATWVCWLLNMPGTLTLASSMVHGQTRSRVPMGRLRDLVVPVPPLDVQRAFAARVAAVRVGREAIERAARADDELFASLRSRAVHGEL